MIKKFSDKSYSAEIDALMSASPSFGMVGAAAYKPGLERSVQMDKILGFPSRDLRCIHVAGTNGKGSVCNMLAACISRGGGKVGLYTSPHILDFRERIRIVDSGGFRLVPREWVFDFLQKYKEGMESLNLSFFEITTAMCFKYFSEQKVDVAVIETGLGGRFDATNILVPELSVITNIGLDHKDLLGDTLEKIATEKAGIIKHGRPVVIGESDSVTTPVFEASARRCESELHFADRIFANAVDNDTYLPSPSEMDLPGCYQTKNVRTAACALHVFGAAIDLEGLKNAARICGFHGRWEKIMDNPLTVCDIGHNAHGLKYNFSQLSQMLENGEVSDIVMVYGSVKDKDVDAVLELIPEHAHVVFTAADNLRAMGAQALYEKFKTSFGLVPGRTISVRTPVGDAVKCALEICHDMQNPLLYIGGSTYVVSEAMKSLGVEF